jgi:hypothetical protein
MDPQVHNPPDLFIPNPRGLYFLVKLDFRRDKDSSTTVAYAIVYKAATNVFRLVSDGETLDDWVKNKNAYTSKIKLKHLQLVTPQVEGNLVDFMKAFTEEYKTK